ncbi:hypothetical protein DLJ59_02030 [Micromonospora inaquosa]|uniref:Uncharacterized protein n=1 Tax=Micromonospora inaquosa TaxID=2203716 RepID=A0A3N9X4X3_9ACTN|nr:hypothetical protein DLJ59_02030 [Micromonospora inaquosa]
MREGGSAANYRHPKPVDGVGYAAIEHYRPACIVLAAHAAHLGQQIPTVNRYVSQVDRPGQADLAPPVWVDARVLRRAWFPAELAIHRADALAWAPAAFRKHGVYLSVHDLAAA